MKVMVAGSAILTFITPSLASPTSLPTHWGRIRNPQLFEARQILLPLLIALCAELAQIAPRIQPGVMTVVEHELDRVLPDGLDRADADVVFAELQGFLTRAVATNFGRRRVHAQIF